jgi:hypothetical protein
MARDRHERGQPERFAAEAQQRSGDLGGQSPPPVLRMKPVSQLDLVRLFDVEVPDDRATRDSGLVRIT